MSIHFLCVIGDEAQHLKNRKTNNSKSMSSLSRKEGFYLGTPIENSVSDLISLLEFLPGARPSLPQPLEEGAELA